MIERVHVSYTVVSLKTSLNTKLEELETDGAFQGSSYGYFFEITFKLSFLS